MTELFKIIQMHQHDLSGNEIGVSGGQFLSLGFGHTHAGHDNVDPFACKGFGQCGSRQLHQLQRAIQ